MKSGYILKSHDPSFKSHMTKAYDQFWHVTSCCAYVARVLLSVIGSGYAPSVRSARSHAKLIANGTAMPRTEPKCPPSLAMAPYAHLAPDIKVSCCCQFCARGVPTSLPECRRAQS